ncbi:MAG: VTT domain-containing protein [Anaerolineae bacterium]|nr:VTT domain-containing protein [Anaerolineae bacterium]MDW8099361.1 VTT domain-containing protein [Anaerolineae bacterium]
MQRSGRFPWQYIALTAALLGAVVIFWRPLVQLATDVDSVQAWLASLGPWGPVAMILASAAQIVFAPVPGYFVQVAGGYLFGMVPGAIYGTLGMLLGGTIAMTLSRRFGRPFVERKLGAERIRRWEQVVHANSIWVWFLLMAGPTGDVPYYLAGLTQVPMWKILGIVLFTRGPAITVAAAIGAGAADLSPELLLGLLVLVLLLGALFFKAGRQVARRLEAFLLHRMVKTIPPPEQP